MIESAAQIDRDDQFELELEQAALESVVNTEDYAHDLADLDFQRYSELSDDSMPRLERVCDDGTVVDDTLAEQAISDVIAWSQKPIVKPTGSNRNIPPVRSLDQY